MATQDVDAIVRDIADDYGVPEWVWKPIMLMESGGNPKSWNNPKDNGGKEDSRGLFQINLKAHPQWKNLDLFDPKVNASIAFPNFIVPAWNKIKGTDKSEGDKAAYVWRYGIRPKWTDAKDAAIKEKVIKVMGTPVTGGTTTGSGGNPKTVIGLPFGNYFGDETEIAPGYNMPGWTNGTPDGKIDSWGGLLSDMFGLNSDWFKNSIITIVIVIVIIILGIFFLKSLAGGGGGTVVITKEGGTE